jgi:hypothetical protein
MDKTGGTFHFPAIQLVPLSSAFNYWLNVKDMFLVDRLRTSADTAGHMDDTIPVFSRALSLAESNQVTVSDVINWQILPPNQLLHIQKFHAY